MKYIIIWFLIGLLSFLSFIFVCIKENEEINLKEFVSLFLCFFLGGPIAACFLAWTLLDSYEHVIVIKKKEKK